MKVHTTFQCRAKMSKAGFQRLDRIRSILNGLYNSALEERRDCWEKEGEVVTRCAASLGLQAGEG